MEIHEKAKETLRENLVLITKEAYLFSVRLSFTVNSGAIVVLLAFIGGAQADTVFSISLGYLKGGMLCFVVGLVFAFISLVSAYFVSHRGFRDIERYLSRSSGFPTRMITIPLLSFLSFSVGALLIIFGVEQLKI